MGLIHKSILLIRLPEHRFEYTGIDAKLARAAVNKARAEGREVSTDKRLVIGSSTLFHYTVISKGV